VDRDTRPTRRGHGGLYRLCQFLQKFMMMITCIFSCRNKNYASIPWEVVILPSNEVVCEGLLLPCFPPLEF
jgi:hypothetical protein